ncbi:MAG: ATP-binding protein [Candidatus Symbiothrix sp.]|jgi:predicted ATPase|nr:ATP-binding protein [Candidatus Symbiothrix sp.]
MIDKIKINNFKSIVDMTLDLGRVNVIIGANGCGKTNILEAITFASAASQDKLDNEFLLNRGIRVTEPQFMASAFEDVEQEPYLMIKIYEDGETRTDVNVMYLEDRYLWINTLPFAKGMVTLASEEEIILPDVDKLPLAKFLTYSPSENVLRKNSFETTIFPIGRNGEGLLAYLKNLSTKEEGKEIFKEINEGLTMLDWFEGLNIPDNLMSNEYGLNIGDRFLKESLHYFDQRSTNEGFLFLLFYLTLFNSKQTPSFFAVDNIETSFNPKLCTKLIKYLVERAKKKEKQVILTTHSPYILDGLDLSDDEQRLFVARRDIDGHTRIERIPYREDRDMLLSDLWMSGLIGGLPDNF